MSRLKPLLLVLAVALAATSAQARNRHGDAASAGYSDSSSLGAKKTKGGGQGGLGVTSGGSSGVFGGASSAGALGDAMGSDLPAFPTSAKGQHAGALPKAAARPRAPHRHHPY